MSPGVRGCGPQPSALRTIVQDAPGGSLHDPAHLTRMSRDSQSTHPPHWLDPPDWWRKVRPLRWLAAFALFAFIAHVTDLLDRLAWTDRSLPALLGGGGPHPDNARFTRVAVGVDLLDRFRSYANLDAVVATLREDGYEDYRVSMRRAPDSPRYPTYRFDTLSVDDYRHLGQAGELSLQFFNGRLFEAEFAPEEPRAYARQLRRLRLKREANARAERIDGHRRIASTVELAISNVGVHLGTRPYVLWQDLRLIDELRAWDERFGAIPKRIVTNQ